MNMFPLIAILIAGFMQDEGPVQEPVFVVVDKLNADDVFAWDWPGLDLDGNPVAVDRLAYVFASVVEGPIAVPERQVSALNGSVSAGITTHRVADILVAVPPGRYRLYVQLRSADGLWGQFSPELLIEVVSGGGAPAPPPRRAPAPPTGLRHEKRVAPAALGP